MSRILQGKLLAAIRIVALLCVVSFSIAPPTVAAPHGRQASKGTAVVYPIVFKRRSGTDGSHATALQAVREVLQKAGYTLISDTVASSTWKHLRIPYPATDSPPRRSEVVRFGKAVKAQYVVYPRFDFHSRSIWVNLGPRTVSTVTTDMTITDVTTGQIVYRKKGVQGRSDEKQQVAKIAAAVLISPLVSAVSGGPKTPQEQRAAQISVARALTPWLKQ